MNIAYIASRYPLVSHSFVQNEVWELRRLGASVTTVSVREVDVANILSTRDTEDAQSTINIIPLRVNRALKLSINCLRNSSPLVKTLKFALLHAPKGFRAKLWSIFYVFEAVLLWDELRHTKVRHVHAHFANVACDVAMLLTEFGNHIQATNIGNSGRWTWSFTMHGPTEFDNVDRYSLPTKADQASAIICISDFCRSQLMSKTPTSSWPKMQIVHCGIDTEKFSVPSKAVVKQQTPLNILCVGRLVDEKAQRLLVTAMATLLVEKLNVKLTLVGDGPNRTQLVQLAADLQISNDIVFAGVIGQDEISSYYASADIFCLPSFSEGLPVVLMEAMASGLPVVSTRIAGIPELVVDGDCGFLVAPGNIDELTTALRRLAQDRKLRDEFSAKGRLRVEHDFNINQTAKELFHVMQTAANG